MTADKFNTREYLRYTGYPGGQRSYTPADLMAKSKLKTIKPGKHPLFIKVVKACFRKAPRRPAAQQRVCLQFGRASLPGR